MSIVGDGNIKLANNLAKDGYIDGSKQMMNDIRRDIHRYQTGSKNAAILIKQREGQQRRSLSLVEPALDNPQIKSQPTMMHHLLFARINQKHQQKLDYLERVQQDSDLLE